MPTLSLAYIQYLSFTNFRYSIRKNIKIINKRKISLYYIKYIVLERNNQLNLAQKLAHIRLKKLKNVSNASNE
jgi:hypothetical protein